MNTPPPSFLKLVLGQLQTQLLLAGPLQYCVHPGVTLCTSPGNTAYHTLNNAQPLLIQGQHENAVARTVAHIIELLCQSIATADMLQPAYIRSSEHQIRVAVPDRLAGLVLGRDGTAIQRMAELSKAKLRMSERGQFAQLAERHVVISGTPLAAAKAAIMIFMKLRTEPERAVYLPLPRAVEVPLTASVGWRQPHASSASAAGPSCLPMRASSSFEPAGHLAMHMPQHQPTARASYTASHVRPDAAVSVRSQLEQSRQLPQPPQLPLQQYAGTPVLTAAQWAHQVECQAKIAQICLELDVRMAANGSLQQLTFISSNGKAEQAMQAAMRLINSGCSRPLADGRGGASRAPKPAELHSSASSARASPRTAAKRAPRGQPKGPSGPATASTSQAASQEGKRRRHRHRPRAPRIKR